ncbi:hypothetical protein ACFYM0_19905 [Streptomyces sp. NPDC006487]|uniref:hypothetical protein n=1 Tax=Streptomyces sp. NPDC006487 TaxID=3364748 RepID=UPI003696639F
METPRKDLYPDVAALGDLAQAMTEVAALRGCDIGSVHSVSGVAKIDTVRGVVSVDLSTEQRNFLVSVYVPEFTWPIGSTDDLGLLVEALTAWREGMAFDEFEAKFTFVRLDAFVRAIENGEPASAQWADLLSSEFHRPQWDLMRRIHEDETLRVFYPTISHGAVRLRVDAADGASRQVLVQELGEKSYKVLRVGVPASTWVEVPAGDLIAYLRTALTRE